MDVASKHEKKNINSKASIKSGFKHTSVGWIPVDWDVFLLDEISEKITVGIATEVKPFITKKGIPIIRNQNIRPGYFDDSDIIYITEEFDKANYNKKTHSGDIIIVRTGSNVGQACVVPKQYHNSQTFTTLIVRPKTQLDPEFLALHINSHGIKEVERLSAGGGKPNLNAGFLKEYRIALPSLFEQQSISSLLSTWDKAISNLQLLIDKKEQRKKWLMQQLLTGKKRLKGFKGKWEKVNSSEVFRNVSVKGFVNEELLSATQENGIIPRSKLEARVTMPAGETNSFKLVEEGDFVISLRSFQGGIEYSYYRGIVSPAYTVLKPKVKINEEFYKYYFKSQDFIGRLSVAVIGIRDGKQINYDDFCIVKIPAPSIQEQNAIATTLYVSDKEIKILNQKLERLKEQKRGLMQVLLTGKKRLKA